ncbi:unnamed protein product [Acanthoscelides obtectus]|uniref:Uncharacterized protein n=1 Tax=Acanthoscelides obtectus TaxID=200917 RepID=A0A9P0PNR0_ACAOB|nr:unnamed protein product [Acanthoscelides obtectus]CAK1662650.1 hypothetical protein AOBTE_LOCUS23253 [Acanthoscelides obtectus]
MVGLQKNIRLDV